VSSTRTKPKGSRVSGEVGRLFLRSLSSRERIVRETLTLRFLLLKRVEKVEWKEVS